MGTLIQDIETQADWIVKAFAADRLKLNYTIHSFIEIDKFFSKHSKNGQPVKGGRLSQNLGPIIFSIGSYIGQTIVKTIPGAKWQTDDNDPEGELNVSIVLPDGTTIWPVQRAMKRYQNGPEDSVYVYGHPITKDLTNESFDESYWRISDKNNNKNPWWKFW